MPRRKNKRSNKATDKKNEAGTTPRTSPRAKQQKTRRSAFSDEDEEGGVSLPLRRKKPRHEKAKSSHDDDDDDSSVEQLPPARKSNSDEDFALQSSSSEEEELKETPSRLRKRRTSRKSDKKKKAKQRKRASLRDASSSSSDSDQAPSRRTPSSRKSTRKRSPLKNSDDEGSSDSNGRKIRHSPRHSPRKSYRYDEDDDDDAVPIASARKRKAHDEDEEYKLQKDSNSSSSEDDILEEEGEDVWSEEEEKEEEENVEVVFSQDSDEDESGGNRGQSPGKTHVCDSKYDAITMDELPVKHVCYFPPDESSCQCFALETLRKIALASGHPKFRSTLGNDQQTFLQPPHFRSAMQDDLLDQIASRFGREALDLHGSYYYRGHSIGDEIAPILHEEQDDDLDADFIQQMDEYVQGSMRSQDLYVCPLCYTAAHKRMVHWNAANGPEESEMTEDQLADIYTTEFTADPIRILSSLDNGELDTAATFCFRLISQVKEHLRKEHDADTKVIDGNDLYSKFKIRATDGLLQRYLNSGQRRYRKSMQSYWHKDANSYEFCYLVTLVRQVEKHRRDIRDREQNNVGESGSDNEVPEIPDFVAAGNEYFTSIASLNESLWSIVSHPFQKFDAENDDFLDNDEPEDDVDVHRVAFHDPDAVLESVAEVEEMVDRIQQRYKIQMGQEDADHSNIEENEGDDHDDDDLVEQIRAGDDLQDTSSEDEHPADDQYLEGMVEQSSSDDDDWERNIRVKRRGSIGRRRPPNSSGRKRRQRKKAAQTLSDSARKRLAIASSSDED